jgi:hypothetical protein
MSQGPVHLSNGTKKPDASPLNLFQIILLSMDGTPDVSISTIRFHPRLLLLGQSPLSVYNCRTRLVADTFVGQLGRSCCKSWLQFSTHGQNKIWANQKKASKTRIRRTAQSVSGKALFSKSQAKGNSRQRYQQLFIKDQEVYRS